MSDNQGQGIFEPIDTAVTAFVAKNGECLELISLSRSYYQKITAIFGSPLVRYTSKWGNHSIVASSEQREDVKCFGGV